MIHICRPGIQSPIISRKCYQLTSEKSRGIYHLIVINTTPDGDITKDDYEPDKLASVKAEHWELRSANADDETDGIVYYARIDIYKLKDVEPSEAVACVISFNGATKAYRYNAV